MKRRAALVLLTALALSGCQLQPIYAGGGSGAVATTMQNIEIGPIDNRSGWLVRQALIDRFGTPNGTATYRVEVELDDSIKGFGIRADEAITRERRTLRARYRLVSADKGLVLLDTTAVSDAGVDVTTSEYATIAAEQTALERLSVDIANQIATRVAIYIRNQKP